MNQEIVEIEDDPADDATIRISNKGLREIRNLTGDRLNTGQIDTNNNLRTRLQTRTAPQIDGNNLHEQNNDQAHIVMPPDEC